MKTRRSYNTFLLTVMVMLACNRQQGTAMRINEIKQLDSIPSASGIAVTDNDSLYIIGDDATSIYLMSLKNYGYAGIPLANRATSQRREAKAIKHDFESAMMFTRKGSKYLLAFGSGSNAITRDSLLVFYLSSHRQQMFSLKKLYSGLQTRTHTSPDHWNIEGSAVSGDSLFLLNRGDNSIISVRLDGFLEYLFESEAPMIAYSHVRVKLPTIDGKEARLSGVSTLPGGDLLFCASVEDTPDWTSDGPVLGSFIGIYSSKSRMVKGAELLRDKAGKALREKIESVDILKSDKADGYQVIAVSDNDDGSSKIFRITLKDGW